MSTLLVQNVYVEAVRIHPNADALDIVQVLGWQVVVRRGEYRVGDRATYFPPDTVLPVATSDAFGVTQYLDHGRIQHIRLRGEPSFGLLVKTGIEDCGNLAEHFGATKWIPPIRPVDGNCETPHPLFTKYTEIENFRHYWGQIFNEWESVVVSEKIHGTNCRVGLIEGEFMAGSSQHRRKPPAPGKEASSTYWYPLSLPGVKDLLGAFPGSRRVILFGEVFGPRIQSYHYGVKNGFGFRAFDLLVDDRYLDAPAFGNACFRYGVEMAPCWYIKFDVEKVVGLANSKNQIGGDNPREGVVIRPMVERHDPRIGRVILKYHSDSYLTGKHSDFNDE